MTRRITGPNIQRVQNHLSEWAQNQGGAYRNLWNWVCDKSLLEEACQHVLLNRGQRTPGVDGVTGAQWKARHEEHMGELLHDLCTGVYQPCPCRLRFIPKGDGRKRPLGIPALRDRVVQEMLRRLIEPLFEADFFESSYGYRPGRSAQGAITSLLKALDRQEPYYVIEGDIRGCFTAIRHDRLLARVRRRVRDRKVLTLTQQFLDAGVMLESGEVVPMEGTPQGGIISPLLANVYLHDMDVWAAAEMQSNLNTMGSPLVRGYVRYADDFVVLCVGEEEEVKQLRRRLKEFLWSELRLKLAMGKSHITPETAAFEFLGFRIVPTREADRRRMQLEIPAAAYLYWQGEVERILGAAQMTSEAKAADIGAKVRGWEQYYRIALRNTEERLRFSQFTDELGRLTERRFGMSL
ncbi:MAG: group II intron reverse transcriptase/maturase [Armatimonadota bacterium]